MFLSPLSAAVPSRSCDAAAATLHSLLRNLVLHRSRRAEQSKDKHGQGEALTTGFDPFSCILGPLQLFVLRQRAQGHHNSLTKTHQSSWAKIMAHSGKGRRQNTKKRKRLRTRRCKFWRAARSSQSAAPLPLSRPRLGARTRAGAAKYRLFQSGPRCVSAARRREEEKGARFDKSADNAHVFGGVFLFAFLCFPTMAAVTFSSTPLRPPCRRRPLSPSRFDRASRLIYRSLSHPHR